MSKLKRAYIVLLCLFFTIPMCIVSNTNNVYAGSPAPPIENTQFISDTCTLSHQYPVPNSITYDLSGTSKLYISCSYNTGGCAIADYNKFNVRFSNSSNSNLWNKDFTKNTTAEIDVESVLSFVTDEAKKNIKITISPIYGCEPINGNPSSGYYDYAFYISASIRGELKHTHSYTSSVTTNATCTTAGITTWRCSCGDSYTTPIPATGHTFQTLKINGQKAAERCIKCGSLGSGNLTPVKFRINIILFNTISCVFIRFDC